MEMLDTSGKSNGSKSRRPGILTKLECMNKSLRHKETKHIPISDILYATYDYIVNLVQEYGTYPLQLDESDLEMTEPMKGKA